MKEEKKSLQEIADIFNNADIKTTPFIEIDELTKYLTDYDKYSETFNIVFDILSFQKLSVIFNEIEIFDLIIKDPNISDDTRDIINSKLTKRNIEKICNVFNENKDNKLCEFIIEMYVYSLSMINIISTNFIFSQKINDKYTIIPEEPTENNKKHHFYAPQIPLYELRMSMNLRIKALLENGETIESLSNLNIVFAVYILLQLRSMGI